MNKGILYTTENMSAIILNPKTNIEYAEIVGQLLWSRGLRIQAHCRRVSNDLAGIESRTVKFHRNKKRVG